jgi:hypothetical protein
VGPVHVHRPRARKKQRRRARIARGRVRSRGFVGDLWSSAERTVGRRQGSGRATATNALPGPVCTGALPAGLAPPPGQDDRRPCAAAHPLSSTSRISLSTVSVDKLVNKWWPSLASPCEYSRNLMSPYECATHTATSSPSGLRMDHTPSAFILESHLGGCLRRRHLAGVIARVG